MLVSLLIFMTFNSDLNILSVRLMCATIGYFLGILSLLYLQMYSMKRKCLIKLIRSWPTVSARLKRQHNSDGRGGLPSPHSGCHFKGNH